MQEFEKLGVFYLGRVYDLDAGRPADDLLLYDSRDLVTHGLIIGMTGSGKTGLGIALIEEAAIDAIPAIVIDPKGDLGNLLLGFPRLQAADFLPWVSAEEARRQGLSPDELAEREASRWKEGLARWGQDGQRIRRLQEAAELRLLTPGSNAGLPVSILRSFAAPEAAVREDAELFAERVSTTVSGLLGLLRIVADPLRSREHILISTILQSAWRDGKSLDLASLIQQVQKPPMARVGVLELESFYPAKERFELSLSINNLLAAPGFETWLAGEPLDVDGLLHGPDGRPRVSILSIAHLDDAQRMFFVSLLLSQVLGWMRGQSGTTSLRALLYMDEIAGYMPPVANPPSKPPLLRLLKQARAFGLGVVLATQNPVDLDYKGLSNIGTWFLGRLQTERDKARVMEGLEGAAATGGRGFDRARMEQVLAGLGSRVFLMNNVHEDGPVTFRTRWTLSYLCGPLARDQIRRLAGAAAAAPLEQPQPGLTVEEAGAAPSAARPVLAPEIAQYFLPVRSAAAPGATLVYRPGLVGAAELHFLDAKRGIDAQQKLLLLAPLGEGPLAVDWDSTETLDLEVGELAREPEPEASFAPLAAEAADPKGMKRAGSDLQTWIYRNRKLELLRSPGLDTLSRPGESERDFRVRLAEQARERRDREADRLRVKYAPRRASLEERLRRAEQAVAREAEQARSQKLQTAISIGATVLGSLFGRKRVSVSSLGRATTAARGVGRSMKESGDVERAFETVGAVRAQIEALERELQSDLGALGERLDPQREELERFEVRLRKSDISVPLVGIGWVPWWRGAGGLKAAWR